MKIPFPIRCLNGLCKAEMTLLIDIDATNIEAKCNKCGSDNSGSQEVDKSYLLLHRASHEFIKNRDFSMTIVFSAMAFECELSRLYFKWKKLNDEEEITDEMLEIELRKKDFLQKLQEVSNLLVKATFVDFIQKNGELKRIVEVGYPSLKLSEIDKSIREHLFWPRNRILHLGYGKYNEKAATKCYQVAALGLKILNGMEERASKTVLFKE